MRNRYVYETLEYAKSKYIDKGNYEGAWFFIVGALGEPGEITQKDIDWVEKKINEFGGI